MAYYESLRGQSSAWKQDIKPVDEEAKMSEQPQQAEKQPEDLEQILIPEDDQPNPNTKKKGKGKRHQNRIILEGAFK